MKEEKVLLFKEGNDGLIFYDLNMEGLYNSRINDQDMHPHRAMATLETDFVGEIIEINNEIFYYRDDRKYADFYSRPKNNEFESLEENYGN